MKARLTMCLLVAAAFAEGAAEARMYRSFKNDSDLCSQPPPDQYSGVIVLKFHNETGMKAARDAARFFTAKAARSGGELASLRGSLARAAAGVPKTLFTRPVDDLNAERAQAERNAGETLPDLTLFYEIPVAGYQAACELLDAMRTNGLVEVAYARPLPVPPPTANLMTNQLYLRPASANGYDVFYAWSRPGGDGSQARLIDIEYQWTVNHEDLQKAPTNILWGTEYTNFGPDHGTASIGASAAISNSYGMAGIVHKARADMISSCDAGGGWVLANAINQAVSFTQPGDVILLEQQAYNYDLGNYCPVEYMADVYSAIANAAALDRIIIEPAGNGSLDLDDAAWGGIFQRSTRDSGAILVGAGTRLNRSRCDFSDYGSRVDIQGWGDWSVATLGEGDLAGSTDTDKYTKVFAGTSSASALSAGVAASVQSYARANYGFYLPTLLLRSNLVQSGYAQTFGPAGNIGPLPNLSNAYSHVDLLATDPDGDGLLTWQEYFAGTDPTNWNSCLGFDTILPPAGSTGIVVRWQSVDNKRYRLERGSNLVPQPSFDVLLQTNILGFAPMNTATDTTATGSGPWYYRIKLE